MEVSNGSLTLWCHMFYTLETVMG